MFHSEYESRLRSPSKSPSKQKQNYNRDLPPIPSPFLNFSQPNSNNSPISSNSSNSTTTTSNNNNNNNNNSSNIIANSNGPVLDSFKSPSKLKNQSLILPQSPSKIENYGDRFIPISIGIDSYSSSLDGFNQSLSKQQNVYSNNSNNQSNNINSVQDLSSNTLDNKQRDESHLAYNLILKNEILGPSSYIDHHIISSNIKSTHYYGSSGNNSNNSNNNITNNIDSTMDQYDLMKSHIHSPIKGNGYSLSSGNILQFSSPSSLQKSNRQIHNHTIGGSNSLLNGNHISNIHSPLTNNPLLGNGNGLDSPYSLSPLSDDSQRILSSPRKPHRKISKTPFKVLDAPSIRDDFYLNLVDWSSLNVLAVGLEHSVYLWNASTSQVSKLCDLEVNQPISSVSWIQRGTHLAVGGNDGIIQIWDVTKKKKIRELKGQTQRVNALAWNSHLLSSGGKDKVILHHDVRDPSNFSQKLIGHKHEICGLKWAPDGQQLASGGNDNLLNVWDHRMDGNNGINNNNNMLNNSFSIGGISKPLYQFKFHSAAVKAIAWSPHQRGLLASGGGTHDKCIRFTNTLNGQPIQSIDTGSQVCNLAWSKNVNELVSTHGFSQNQITVWSYPSMTPVTTLTGHTTRVLYLAVSPDGQTLVTGAGDQTLRFWNVFPNKDSNSCNLDSFYNSKYDMDIR
ncbi:WD40 repeat-containing protein [Tieghemostelium lacteum]|uniref:WD40 repeat-containing protein n=1 Tax=Tieghemostelium lacteum TaxID=361077 RepID=A0A151Z7P9_TIELA|nr:WD40 repeat-containing protein [Tieghemostelium lacteum]|eukprot:KYQ89993.1 WD40 repeat-containing protein [Tieghemostelium lacteum]